MMAWLVPIIEAILRALIPAGMKSTQPTAEDSRPQPQLRERLRAKVRHAGWTSAMLLLLSCVAAGTAGCGNRTVYVPSGEPVRLRETVKGAKVWVMDAGGKPVAGRMDLPEGWYVLPGEYEQ